MSRPKRFVYILKSVHHPYEYYVGLTSDPDGRLRSHNAGLSPAADQCFAVGIVCADYTESPRLTEEQKPLAADIGRAERDVVALEEEARLAGVPPGWVRE